MQLAAQRSGFGHTALATMEEQAIRSILVWQIARYVLFCTLRCVCKGEMSMALTY